MAADAVEAAVADGLVAAGLVAAALDGFATFLAAGLAGAVCANPAVAITIMAMQTNTESTGTRRSRARFNIDIPRFKRSSVAGRLASGYDGWLVLGLVGGRLRRLRGRLRLRGLLLLFRRCCLGSGSRHGEHGRV